MTFASLLESFVGIISSQPNFFRHKFLYKSLALERTVETKPNGSNSEQMIDELPFFCLWVFLNANIKLKTV